MAQLNVNDYGVLPDGNDCSVAWDAVKLLGNNFYFPFSDVYKSGTYVNKKGWRVLKDNVTISGDGKGVTILTVPDSVNGYMEMSGYRNVGWQKKEGAPYENDIRVGQKFIDLRKESDVARFKAGDKIFINAGASYYDQEYGEFNIIESVSGKRVSLRYNINRNYDFESSSFTGRLTEDFNVPPVGEKAIAVIAGVPSVNTGFISLNNDLFKVIAVSGNNVTLLNTGNGENSATFFPARTKVFKGRSIWLTPQSSNNVVIRDLTTIGRRNGLSISNSLNVSFINVEVVRLPSLIGDSESGLVIDGDDGRFCTFSNCDFKTETLHYSQIARSFSNLKFIDCKFFNAALNFSEFAQDILVDRCEFHFDNPNKETEISPLGIGVTTSNIVITNNKINCSGLKRVIASTPDIMSFHAAGNYATIIKDNIFNLHNCRQAISMSRGGVIEIANNKMFGSVGIIFGVMSVVPNKKGDENIDESLNMAGSYTNVHHNSFVGSFDQVAHGELRNIVFEDNFFNQFDEYTPGGSGEAKAYGNIMYTRIGLADPGYTPEMVIFRNNLFKNFRYRANSFNYKGGYGQRVDISNNRFFDTPATFNNVDGLGRIQNVVTPASDFIVSKISEGIIVIK